MVTTLTREGHHRTEKKKAALTKRQKQVLNLLSLGYKQKEVAAYLGIALITNKNHTKMIKDFLEAANTTHAVAIAIRRGLI